MKLKNPSVSGLWVDYKSPGVNYDPSASAGGTSNGLTFDLFRKPRKKAINTYAGPSTKKSKRSLRSRATLTRRDTTRGAVRLDSADTATTSGSFHKVSLAALILAGGAGIFATTTTTGNVNTSDFKSALLAALPVPVPMPTFRFDDADTALSEQNALTEPEMSSSLQMASISRPQSQAFTPQSFASLLPSTDRTESQQKTNSALPGVPKSQDSGSQRTGPLSPLAVRLPAQAWASAAVSPQLKDNYTNVVEVKSGDTFLGILKQEGVPDDQLVAMLQDSAVKEHLSHLKIGGKLNFEYRWDGLLNNINIKISRDTRVRIINDVTGGYTIEQIHLPVEYERVVTSGTIDQSLYLAAERANLKQSTIMALADIFEWELDFARDIRKGDKFSIVYDRLYRDGKYIGDGEILAAEFKRGDRVHNAIRFTDDEGHSDYYSRDGHSKRRAFMRHPVDIVRITSRFDPNRLHPVLHKLRAHKGVDYGAPYGSPIYATADGKVEFSGDKRSYGNTVVLQHGDNRSTLYAHMSKISKKSKTGSRIKRGDVIGYVGKTGRVTGTHLHYEFRIAGKHVDPLKVELPGAPPLDKKYHAKLKATAGELYAQMHSVIPATEQIALSE